MFDIPKVILHQIDHYNKIDISNYEIYHKMFIHKVKSILNVCIKKYHKIITQFTLLFQTFTTLLKDPDSYPVCFEAICNLGTPRWQGASSHLPKSPASSNVKCLWFKQNLLSGKLTVQWSTTGTLMLHT